MTDTGRKKPRVSSDPRRWSVTKDQKQCQGESSVDFSGDGDVEKDEAELILEKLVFGDESGFLSALQPDERGQEVAVSSNSHEERETLREGNQKFQEIPDEDVCPAYPTIFRPDH